MSAAESEPVLQVRDLVVDIGGDDAQPALVDRVSFDVHAGRTVALIGESGCGKTMTAMAILGLLPPAARIVRGQILLKGRDLLALSERELRQVRGAEIGTVFQDPMASLNPTMCIGDQIAESRMLHARENSRRARAKALELLQEVGIPNARTRLDAYPHELSGGMQQRVMIAMAISCEPALLIADEPTTALDVTIQAEILELLGELRSSSSMAMLLVTHDLGVVAGNADQTVVMYAGQVAESAGTSSVFAEPLHPYTSALLRAIPQNGAAHTRLASIPGRVPAAGHLPIGCRFFSRCEHALAGTCDAPDPQVRQIRPQHRTSCVRVESPASKTSEEARGE